jgi:hypothetical protein
MSISLCRRGLVCLFGQTHQTLDLFLSLPHIGQPRAGAIYQVLEQLL